MHLQGDGGTFPRFYARTVIGALAARFRDRAQSLDWAIALTLCGLTVAGWAGDRARQPTWALLIDLAACLALRWRRHRPLQVLAVVISVDAVQIVADVPANTLIYATLIAVYSVAAYGTRWQAVLGLLATYAGIFGSLLAPKASIEGGMVAAAALLAVAAIAGDNIRTRRAYLAEVEARAARLELERDTQAQIATAAERTRIAREMHDVVAHNLSVMVAQADGAAYVFDSSPDQARQAIATVADTGRQALTEMHRLLGVLRSTDLDNDLAPQPGVEQLDELIRRTKSAGLPVSLTIEGTPVSLSPGMSLTVYRIVQEALTNTLKHSGPRANATVRLRYLADQVELDIRDDGYALPGGSIGVNGGHGLEGMRERTAVFGGSLDAGAVDGHGWRIHACLPFEGGP